MKPTRALFLILLAVFCSSLVVSAAGDGRAARDNVKPAFVEHYAELLQAEYADALALAIVLQTNIEKFVTDAAPGRLDECRTAWTACRAPYSQTEAARFYDGPIDRLEGFINAWPIDENYLDYTAAAPGAGIINQTGAFPNITMNVILDANAKEGDKTISTGFHAIEYLLWGQDLYADGPGRRSYLDYVDAPSGPGRHAARRRLYLRLLARLLVQHLHLVAIQWTPGNPSNYRARLLAERPDEALRKIFNGLGNMSGSELRGERILVPYTTQSQENEQCCFSDTTHLDLLRNEFGIQNMFLGRYQRTDGRELEGVGLLAVVETVDPKLAGELKKKLAAGVAALQAVPPPFDQAIRGRDSGPGRVALRKALAALQAQTDAIVKAAAVLGIQINLK